MLNAQFAKDGTTTTFNNLNIGGLISGIGLNQINRLITNAVTTLQANGSFINLTVLSACTLPTFTSVGSTLLCTSSALQPTSTSTASPV